MSQQLKCQCQCQCHSQSQSIPDAGASPSAFEDTSLSMQAARYMNVGLTRSKVSLASLDATSLNDYASPVYSSFDIQLALAMQLKYLVGLLEGHALDESNPDPSLLRRFMFEFNTSPSVSAYQMYFRKILLVALQSFQQDWLNYAELPVDHPMIDIVRRKRPNCVYRK